jgi:hypothetical protein
MEIKRTRTAGRLMVALGLAAGVLGAGAGDAAAGSTERADFELGLTSRTPGTATGILLHVRYKARGGDPNTKPSPIREGTIEAPAGTVFHLDRVPICRASDEEFRARGRGACPRESMVGQGDLSIITGFGPPADPVLTDAWIFNTGPGKGLVEVVQQKDQDRTLGFDRADVRDNKITIHPPMTPGGPPDGQSAVREIDFVFDDPTYVTAPSSCPADGLWRSRGTFKYADGVSTTVTSTTPCARGTGTDRANARRRLARMRLKVAPRRVRAGRRARVRVRVAGSRECIRGATVRLARKRARTNRRGRAAIVARLRAGRRYRVTAAKSGCRPARAYVRAVKAKARR